MDPREDVAYISPVLSILRAACSVVLVGTLTGACSPEAAPTTARLSSGADHTCLVSEGGVWCWGWNMFGQLGSTRSPTELPESHAALPVMDATGALSDVVGVTAGAVHSCAHDGDGLVWCWGDNLTGALGTDSDAFFDPTASVPLALGRTVQVAGGGAHTCALLAGGDAACWGNNFFGQLGTGSESNSFVPLPVAADGAQFVAITAGQSHTCALDATGQASCWGDNGSGQLGDGTVEWRNAPRPVLTDLVFAQLDLGLAHSCAVTVAGEVYCWGSNEFGQLASEGESQRQPTLVPALPAISLVRAGLRHTCALSNAGAVFCWGNNASQQVASNDAAIVATPQRVELAAAAMELAPGGTHTCAMMTDEQVYCWGDGSRGQLGRGIETSASPVLVNR